MGIGEVEQPTSKLTKHLNIHGLVQGVGYRYSFYSVARRLGITGWVRNNRDGSVEAMVQGTGEQVASIIGWAKKGPDFAQVERVDVSEGSGRFEDFSIRETV